MILVAVLCTTLLAQDPAPANAEPAEDLPAVEGVEPAPAEPAPRVETPASRRVKAGVAHMRSSAPPGDALPSSLPASMPSSAPSSQPAAAVPPPARREGVVDGLLRRTSSGPLHYAFHYAPDYASVAVLGVLGFSAWQFPPPVADRAAIGSSYNPATRDPGSIYAPRNDRVLGAPFREDTVPSWTIPVVGNAFLFAVGGLSLTRHPSFRKIHHFILGAAQAQLASLLTTELLKSAVGRLRPDFRDRMARYYCATGRGEVPEGTDCTGVNTEVARARASGRSTDGIFIDRDELEDGRRSFPSGHASSSFVLASYLALFIGGEMVWGEHANALTRLPGVAAQLAVLTTAAFVAGTRMTDGRHHAEDVLVGAGLGSAWGALFYFLHFNLLGKPQVRSFNLAPVAGRDGGLGLSINGLMPW